MGAFLTYKRRHRFGWEIGWQTTFTDYLDDVSSIYPNISEVGNPELYYIFTNRSNEVPVNERPLGGDNYAPGEKRGDPSHNDTFIFSSFSYGYTFMGKNDYYRQHYPHTKQKPKYQRRIRAKF